MGEDTLAACVVFALAAVLFVRNHWLSTDHRALTVKLDVLTRRVDLLQKAIRQLRNPADERTVRMTEKQLEAAKRTRPSRPDRS